MGLLKNRYRAAISVVCCALVSGTAAAGAPKTNPLIPPAFSIPQSIGIGSFNFPNRSGELGQFTATGAHLWRADFRWAWFETKKGVYDFSSYDPIMEKCKSARLRCLFILYGANELYPEFPSTGEANLMTSGPQLDGFAKFAAAAAKYFRGKPVIFELGNEPDGTGGPTPEAYVRYARATVTAMRAADPNVCIVGPAAHQYALGWIETVFSQGFLELVDAVSIHLYQGGKPEEPQPKPEDNTRYVDLVRALTTKYSKRVVPLMNSEWGYDRAKVGGENKDYNVTVDEQVRYLARSYLMAALWDLRYSAWFTWYLPDSYDISGYSLITPGMAPYPVYYALKNLTNQLPNATLKRRIDAGSPDNYVLEVKTSDGTRWAAWSAGAGGSVKIPVGKAQRMLAVDVSGTRIYEIPVNAGYATVGMDGGVQYLRPLAK